MKTATTPSMQPFWCWVLHRNPMQISTTHPHPRPGVISSTHIAYECTKCERVWGKPSCAICEETRLEERMDYRSENGHVWSPSKSEGDA